MLTACMEMTILSVGRSHISLIFVITAQSLSVTRFLRIPSCGGNPHGINSPCWTIRQPLFKVLASYPRVSYCGPCYAMMIYLCIQCSSPTITCFLEDISAYLYLFWNDRLVILHCKFYLQFDNLSVSFQWEASPNPCVDLSKRKTWHEKNPMKRECLPTTRQRELSHEKVGHVSLGCEQQWIVVVLVSLLNLH